MDNFDQRPAMAFLYVQLYAARKNEGPAFLRALVLSGAGTRSGTRDYKSVAR